MKMWKQCAAIITAGALVVSLGACGKSAGEGGKEEGGVLTVSIWDNNQLPGVKEIVGDFTEKTGIQVEVQMVPWDQYWTLLEAFKLQPEVYEQ